MVTRNSIHLYDEHLLRQFLQPYLNSLLPDFNLSVLSEVLKNIFLSLAAWHFKNNLKSQGDSSASEQRTCMIEAPDIPRSISGTAAHQS